MRPKGNTLKTPDGELYDHRERGNKVADKFKEVRGYYQRYFVSYFTRLVHPSCRFVAIPAGAHRPP